MGLYENILDACARHDIAPSRLIIESGFASSNIARLKKGKAPHLDMIQGMAERLGMSIDELGLRPGRHCDLDRYRKAAAQSTRP